MTSTPSTSLGPTTVGRFAPSPTGPLHFGSLYTALASYLAARKQGGKWLVRMEDVDQPRCKPEWATSILRTLEAHGFEWDDDVVVQSQRISLYADALAMLRRRGLVYACRCSRKALSSAPRNEQGEVVYPGVCANSPHSAVASQWAERLKVTSGEVEFVDMHFGPQSQNVAASLGDFVIRRADGLFAYHLAVVVDDALQGVNEVVRGGDLLHATHRQILVQRALGFATPRYLHVPVATNARGEKLGKQTHAAALVDARARLSLVEAAAALGLPLADGDKANLASESPASILRHLLTLWEETALPRAPTFIVRDHEG